MKTLCIYHKNCFDGICAAWIVNKVYPDAILVPMQYGENLLWLEHDYNEQVYAKEDNLFIVDFSFKRQGMLNLKEMFPNMIVLDHHKTAEAECKGLDFCKFDMYESGASLTWKYFQNFGMLNGDPPLLVKYIADRDLWNFKLPNSDDINAYIQSWPMTIESYEFLYNQLEKGIGFNMSLEAGSAINRYKKTMVESMCNNAILRNCGGFEVPTINATLLFSEIGHELCKKFPDKPFAASFFIRNDNKMQWSLRSIGNFDVSEVARKMGGGGHKNAAGFEEEMKEFK